MLSLSIFALAILAATNAQFPPPREDIRTIKSRHHEGITISYKEPEICETTPGVKSYSGYIHLPPNSLTEVGEDQNYPINTFEDLTFALFLLLIRWQFLLVFRIPKRPSQCSSVHLVEWWPWRLILIGWFSREWAMFHQLGFQQHVQQPLVMASYSLSLNATIRNLFIRSNEVNMLYIDQPVQVGYSYDTLHNGTRNLNIQAEGDDQDATLTSIVLHNFSDADIPEQNATFLVGTFSSQNQSFTANTTEHAAVALWHFAQTWFEE